MAYTSDSNAAYPPQSASNRILDLSVQIGSIRMPNPVGVASGTFGYGEEYAALVDINVLGALYTKAVTLERREGNPPPRLVETPMGLINSIGLANPGSAQFIEEKLPFLQRLSCPVIVNVAGSTEDDYARVIERIEAALSAGAQKGVSTNMSTGVAGYEINISCLMCTREECNLALILWSWNSLPAH